MTAKIIDSGISAKHAKAWTAGEAIREFLQNWLDVKNEFNCNGTVTWSDGMARIKDGGPGLQLHHLAFGENEKVAGSIGQFGEGMKSAFVSLVRSGRKVTVKSNGLEIHPFLKTSINFGIETLHYKVVPMVARLAARFQGTAILVECSKEELEEGKSYFVEFQKHNDESDFEWMQKGLISKPGGWVYVNGSKIGQISNASFSYHLAGEKAEKAINRDRNAVDMSIIEPAITYLIVNTSSRKVMETVLRDAIWNNGGYEAQLNLGAHTQNKAKVWKRVLNSLVGERALVASGNTNLDALAEYHGYHILHNVSYNMRYFLREIGTKMSGEVVRRPKSKKTVLALKDLKPIEVENYKWACKMVKKYYSDCGKISIAEELQNGADGLYETANDKIWLVRSILNDRERTLQVLLHETVHKASGEDDLTHRFEEALISVAVKIIVNSNKRSIK